MPDPDPHGRYGRRALEQMRQSACDLTVCDGKMPELNGLDVYRQPRDMDPQAARRMMFMTGDMVNETFKSFL